MTGVVEDKDGTPVVNAGSTTLSGACTATFADDSDKPLRFAVFSDPTESDLRGTSAADVKVLETVAQVTQWSPGVDLKRSLQTDRTGKEIWLWFAALALALAVAELVLGNRWSRSK